MDAKLFEERTVFKVVVPLRVERICLRPDFDVTPDFGFGRINQPRPDGFPRRRPFARVPGKVLGASSAKPPVTLDRIRRGNPVCSGSRGVWHSCGMHILWPPASRLDCFWNLERGGSNSNTRRGRAASVSPQTVSKGFYPVNPVQYLNGELD